MLKFPFIAVVCVPLAIGYTYIMVPKALLLDALDYMKTRRGPESTARITPESIEFPENSANTTEFVNSDGSPPGPSSTSAATSSVADYSEGDEEEEEINVVWQLGADSDDSDEPEAPSWNL